MDSRYIPQIRLAEIGKSGQEKLLDSQVLVVGCGALGSTAAMYLAGAGVGKLTVADFDTVEISNLHRQVFFKENEAGKFKAEILKEKVNALNSDVKIEAVKVLVNRPFLESVMSEVSLILDCADNPSTTYLIDSFCSEHSIPMVTAGITGWEAQVFSYKPGSFSYGDVFSPPSDDGGILPCSVAGITGPVAAFASSLQCSEALKVLLGIGEKESRLITADLLSLTFRTIC